MNKINTFEYLKNAGLVVGSYEAAVVSPDLVTLPGTRFYVDSGHANALDTLTDPYQGLQWDKPFATVDFAINQCTANAGDIIYVAPRHAEDLSAADDIDVDVAGVSVIGLGSGMKRPTFTYTNAAGEFVVGASNVTVANMIFNASVTTVLKAIDIEASCVGVSIIGCHFGVDTAGTDEFSNAIVIGDQANYCTIKGCTCHQGTAAAVSFIKSDADNDYCTIEGNFVSGDYSTACIVGDEADDMIQIRGNTLYNGQATGIGLGTEPAIELHANTTGVIADNDIVCNLATMAAAVVADDCHLFRNYYNEDESGAGTGGVIGTASAND